MLARAESVLDDCRRLMDRQATHAALEAIWTVISEANRYVDSARPLGLAQDPILLGWRRCSGCWPKPSVASPF